MRCDLLELGRKVIVMMSNEENDIQSIFVSQPQLKIKGCYLLTTINHIKLPASFR